MNRFGWIGLAAGMAFGLAGCGTGRIDAGVLESQDGRTAAFLTGPPPESRLCVLVGKEMQMAEGMMPFALSPSGRVAAARCPDNYFFPTGAMAFTVAARGGTSTSRVDFPLPKDMPRPEAAGLRCSDTEVWVWLGQEMDPRTKEYRVSRYWRYSLTEKSWREGTREQWLAAPESLRARQDSPEQKPREVLVRFRLRSGRVLESRYGMQGPGETRRIEPDGQSRVLLIKGIGMYLLEWQVMTLSSMGYPTL